MRKLFLVVLFLLFGMTGHSVADIVYFQCRYLPLENDSNQSQLNDVRVPCFQVHTQAGYSSFEAIYPRGADTAVIKMDVFSDSLAHLKGDGDITFFHSRETAVNFIRKVLGYQASLTGF